MLNVSPSVVPSTHLQPKRALTEEGLGYVDGTRREESEDSGWWSPKGALNFREQELQDYSENYGQVYLRRSQRLPHFSDVQFFPILPGYGAQQGMSCNEVDAFELSCPTVWSQIVQE
jgi:hypothetical protein